MRRLLLLGLLPSIAGCGAAGAQHAQLSASQAGVLHTRLAQIRSAAAAHNPVRERNAIAAFATLVGDAQRSGLSSADARALKLAAASLPIVSAPQTQPVGATSTPAAPVLTPAASPAQPGPGQDAAHGKGHDNGKGHGHGGGHGGD